MKKTFRKFYLISLGILLALSAYPVVMGVKIVVLQLLNGGITQQDYARYVIPYTAICLAVLAVATLYPLISKLRKYTVLSATLLALGLFVGMELYMESITINPSAAQGVVAPLDRLQAIQAAQAGEQKSSGGVQRNTTVDWQLFSCVYTPAAVQTYVANPSDAISGTDAVLRQDYSDAFKIHYFLVAFVIVALVTGVFYGYGKHFSQENKTGRMPLPLNLQLVSAVLLIGFCVFANFTGFFRERADVLPPLSAALTGGFFVVLGAAAGVYAGSKLAGKAKWLSVAIPAVAAILICSAMYFGEYEMMGGTLYRFGEAGASLFFQGIQGIAVAPVDILVILLAGGVTAAVMGTVRKAGSKKAAVEPAAS
jgi:hypothetical protein